ncbi:hypothetical protein [Micromonospora sp. NPDC049799]|uniref:hypothetical protein n=1 Tax=Micromonospora sp. NPDC049799 TaxID=3154741 RepID=UPI003404941D
MATAISYRRPVLRATRPNQPALRQVFGRVEEAVRRELAGTTVADMLRDVLSPSPA